MSMCGVLLALTVPVLANLAGVQCAPSSVCQLVSTADVVFLLDSSGWSKVDPVNFQKQLDFVVQFVNSLDIGPSAVQVGVATFSSYPINRFWLNEYQNKSDVLAAIHAIPFSGGNTRTYEALQFALDSAFSPYHGVRDNVPNILIVMTHSYAWRPDKLKSVTSIIKGTTYWSVFAIGIGPRVLQSDLNDIASHPSYVFTVSDFSSLQNIQTSVQNVVCGNVPKKDLCRHNGKTYTTGPTWQEKCENICQCMDTMATNCTQECPQLSSLPSQCHLIQDSNNACCYRLDCPMPLFG